MKHLLVALGLLESEWFGAVGVTVVVDARFVAVVEHFAFGDRAGFWVNERLGKVSDRWWRWNGREGCLTL